MTQLTAAQKEVLRERFKQDATEARLGGEKPSKYFLDKCGSEAGEEVAPLV